MSTIIYTNEIIKTIKYLNDLTNQSLNEKNFIHQKYFHELLDKNYTFNDFKKVIDKKYKQWKGTQFEKFIRPSTLFSKKFETYLNEQSNSEAKLAKLFKSVEQAKRTNWKLD
jgi:uncharacterized phage protein (TIGR02220 family)